MQKIKGQYAYIFASAAALSDVMYYKYDLGLQLRRAYKQNDRETLKDLVRRMDVIVYKLRQYLKVFREQWYKENKTYGFEIQEYRLGGLIERIRSCKKRIEAYCRGEIAKIEELQDELLDDVYNRVWADKRYARSGFTGIASVNVF